MALHAPYFFIKDKDTEGYMVCHNCDGRVAFMATDDLDEKTYQLIELALEEGKRRKAEEIISILGLTK